MTNESELAELESWPYEYLGRAASFLRNGFSYNLRDNRQHSDMSSGPPISRLMSKQLIADLSGTLSLNQEQLQALDWWWVNTINHGNDWFKIDLVNGLGRNTVIAKFAKNGRGAPALSGLYYKVSCKLIILELPGLNLTRNENKDLAKYGSAALQEISNKLHNIVHGEW